MKKVTVYSTPSCHFCHMAKEYFSEQGIAYDEIDVATNMEKRMEIVKRSGQMGVPVITIDNDIVVGFNKPRIMELLGI